MRLEYFFFLSAAEERGVDIQLPEQVLLRVDRISVVGTAVSAATAPVEPSNRNRRTSEVVAGSQRALPKKGRGTTKVDAPEVSTEDAVTSDVLQAGAEDKKQQPLLVLCHLPPAHLLWAVLRSRRENAAAVPDENNRRASLKEFFEETANTTTALAVYASVSVNAIEEAIASFKNPRVFVWLGNRLTRQNEVSDQLLMAAGIPDATTIMMQRLVSDEE